MTLSAVMKVKALCIKAIGRLVHSRNQKLLGSVENASPGRNVSFEYSAHLEPVCEPKMMASIVHASTDRLVQLRYVFSRVVIIFISNDHALLGELSHFARKLFHWFSSGNICEPGLTP